MSLMWENGHAVHAVGVADPLLEMDAIRRKKIEFFPG
jgi:hypothetical protein